MSWSFACSCFEFVDSHEVIYFCCLWSSSMGAGDFLWFILLRLGYFPAGIVPVGDGVFVCLVSGGIFIPCFTIVSSFGGGGGGRFPSVSLVPFRCFGCLFWYTLVSSCDSWRFLFGCWPSLFWALLLTIGMSLKNAALLQPHSPLYRAASITFLFVFGESSVTLIGGVWSLLDVFHAGLAPTMWCGLISIPCLPTFLVSSFLKSWNNSLSCGTIHCLVLLVKCFKKL